MTVKRIILNGSTLYPTTIDEEDIRITDGGWIRMLAGNGRMWHRTFKKRWTIHWTSIPETLLTPIRNAYRTTTTMTFNDVNNTNYTVVSLSKTENLSAERIDGDGIMYYDVDLTIEEE